MQKETKIHKNSRDTGGVGYWKGSSYVHFIIFYTFCFFGPFKYIFFKIQFKNANTKNLLKIISSARSSLKIGKVGLLGFHLAIS